MKKTTEALKVWPHPKKLAILFSKNSSRLCWVNKKTNTTRLPALYNLVVASGAFGSFFHFNSKW